MAAPPREHPRNAFALDGVEAPAHAFAEALARGRLHHAWLLTGPEGVGKASFAYQAARRLLGARPAAEDGAPYGGLASDPQNPASRMVSARSHPDLLVLERDSEDAPARRSIPVDEARRLPEFFSKAPAIAAFRVAIIDAADDLNVNAANAVLKTLEEPSGRGVLLLVSHAPGRLLATIRSRCRRLAFAPWPQARLAEFIALRLGLEGIEAERLAEMAGGAPGRALSLAAQGALELDRQVGELLSSLPDPEPQALAALNDSFRGGEGAERFALAMARIADRLHRAAMVRSLDGQDASAAADRFAGLWDRVASLPAQVDGLNLDRSDAFWSVMADLRALARTHPIA